MLNLLAHEVKYYIKNKKELIEIYVFIISINLLLSFALRSTLTANQELSMAMLWVAMVAGCALGGASLFERDAQSGRLELYQMLPISLEKIVLVKWLSFVALMLAPLLLTLPLLALTGIGPAWHQWALGLAFGTAGVAAITSLGASLMAGTGRGGALLSLVTIPLVVPILIFGTEYCRQAHLWDKNLLFLAAYMFFIVPITCLAGASAIRATN